MKLRDLRSTQQDAYIQEMSELFVAYGYYNTMLSEGKLDEAGAWEKVKSMVGKGISGVKTANDAINKLGQLAQNTAPVQGFDNKVDGLLKKIGDANPKVAELATKYGEWAKKNPVKQGLIIGMLTAVASLAAGPAGGAAAGAVLRAGNELLKGEKASTAVGKAAKGAALGALAGATVNTIGPMIANTDVVFNQIPGVTELSRWQAVAMGTGRPHVQFDAMIPTSLAPKVEKLWDAAQDAYKSGQVIEGNRIMSSLRRMFDDPEYIKGLEAIKATNDQLWQQAVEKAESTKKIISQIAAIAQGAATVADTDSKPQTATKAPAAKPAVSQPAAATPDKRAELKAKQQAWQAQQRRMGKLK